MTSLDFCTVCKTPAASACYSIHPVTVSTSRPFSPDSSHAEDLFTLFTSLPELIPAEALPWEYETTIPNEAMKKLSLAGPGIEVEVEVELFSGIVIPPESDAKRKDNGPAQSFFAGLGMTSTPTRTRPRSMSNPTMTSTAWKKHIQDISEIQSRITDALDEIQRAKNTLGLGSGNQGRIWNVAISRGRKKVERLEEIKGRGVIDVRAARGWVKTLEEFNGKMQIGLKTGSFTG